MKNFLLFSVYIFEHWEYIFLYKFEVLLVWNFCADSLTNIEQKYSFSRCHTYKILKL